MAVLIPGGTTPPNPPEVLCLMPGETTPPNPPEVRYG
jgi:hypothetical protein